MSFKQTQIFGEGERSMPQYGEIITYLLYESNPQYLQPQFSITNEHFLPPMKAGESLKQ